MTDIDPHSLPDGTVVLIDDAVGSPPRAVFKYRDGWHSRESDHAFGPVRWDEYRVVATLHRDDECPNMLPEIAWADLRTGDVYEVWYRGVRGKLAAESDGFRLVSRAPDPDADAVAAILAGFTPAQIAKAAKAGESNA